MITDDNKGYGGVHWPVTTSKLQLFLEHSFFDYFFCASLEYKADCFWFALPIIDHSERKNNNFWNAWSGSSLAKVICMLY